MAFLGVVLVLAGLTLAVAPRQSTTLVGRLRPMPTPAHPAAATVRMWRWSGVAIGVVGVVLLLLGA